MSYNAVTIPPSLAMSSPDAPGLTPESNARDIASLTQALDMVVSQFVRPSVQQANANRETLNEVIDLLSRHAQGLLSQEQRLDQLGAFCITPRKGKVHIETVETHLLNGCSVTQLPYPSKWAELVDKAGLQPFLDR
ncbi:MAG: hypothetical protein HC800_09335 [Phormidesmis sp. RL_2_1]|nr:hypothetical protein [Phormidesmis sp. RL_2_1]